MQYPRDLKVLPIAAARRGRPPIGFGFEVADGLEVELPEAANQPLVRCVENAAGQAIGVLEIDVVAAALVVDPARALAEIAGAAVERLGGGGSLRAQPPVAFELGVDVHGVRVTADLLREAGGGRPALPYLTAVALAGPSVRGSVLIMIRAAADVWDAGDRVLESLQLLDRDRGSGRGGGAAMPLAGR